MIQRDPRMQAAPAKALPAWPMFCQIPLETERLLAYVGLTDKGKPVERRGRKTTGLMTMIVYDSGVAK